MAESPLVLAAATRPFPGETANGDAWTVQWYDSSCRIALLDGLGHGPEAAKAAARAVETLASQPEAGPAQAVELCHRALGGTRGAVGAFVTLDYNLGQMRYASVGNIEGRLWQAGSEQRLMAYRGVLGAHLPTVRVFDFTLAEDWLLVLHSDGISARFALEETSGFAAGDPDVLAQSLLEGWGRQTDDATVVVVRPR